MSSGSNPARELRLEESEAIRQMANRLTDSERAQIAEDLRCAYVLTSESQPGWIVLGLRGYERPAFRGQRPFGVDGRMLDTDGAEITVVLHADANGRLLEIELIRWDEREPIAPQWSSFEVLIAAPEA